MPATHNPQCRPRLIPVLEALPPAQQWRDKHRRIASILDKVRSFRKSSITEDNRTARYECSATADLLPV